MGNFKRIRNQGLNYSKMLLKGFSQHMTELHDQYAFILTSPNAGDSEGGDCAGINGGERLRIINFVHYSTQSDTIMHKLYEVT